MEIESKVKNLLNFINAGSLFHKDGGVLAWEENQKGSSFVYSEISGYFLSLVSFLIKTKNLRESDQAYLHSLKTCHWLLNSMLRDNGSFIDRSTNGELGNKFYFFDDLVITQGLLSFAKITEDEELLSKSLLILKKQISNWEESSVKDLENNIVDSDHSWSTNFGPHHLKVLIPLINASKVSKDEAYIKQATVLKDRVFSKFLENDLLYSQNDSIHSHALLYALEGLTSYYQALPSDELKNIISKNFESLKASIKEGFLPRYKEKNKLNYNPRIDIYFQYLRVGSLIDHLKIAKLECNQKLIIETADKYYNKGTYRFGTDGSGNIIDDKTSWINFMALQYYTSLDSDRALLLEYLV